MIQDQNALAHLQNSWTEVRNLQTRVRRLTLAAGPTGIAAMPHLADLCYNVVLVHGFSVLNEVLEQLTREGHFPCHSRFLGALMAASKNGIPWKDYPLVEKGKDDRNAIAHDSVVVSRAECWKYLDAIEAELKGWQIL